jgi:hypothetical protein
MVVETLIQGGRVPGSSQGGRATKFHHETGDRRGTGGVPRADSGLGQIGGPGRHGGGGAPPPPDKGERPRPRTSRGPRRNGPLKGEGGMSRRSHESEGTLSRYKSDLRNHQAIVQPRLRGCLMVTQMALKRRVSTGCLHSDRLPAEVDPPGPLPLARSCFILADYDAVTLCDHLPVREASRARTHSHSS